MDENRVTACKALEAQLIDRATKDAAFREALVHDPKGVFACDLGITVPATINEQVQKAPALSTSCCPSG